MGIFGNLFGGGSNQIIEYLEKGAVIIDVRTPAEFQGGHVEGAKNFPLQQLNTNIDKIKKMNKAVICCCASGMRSGQANSALKSAGIDSINGGGWTSVNAAMVTS
ncbi:MAG: rhodanese-like domain-containing protein [Reichenbachiella sp.]